MATTTSGKIKLGVALDPAACQLLQQMAAGPRGLGALLEDLIYAEAERRAAGSAEAGAPAPAADNHLLQELEAGRAQLLQLSRRLVAIQEEERRTLSRDLHDTSAQSLTALKLGLASLHRAAARADGPAVVAGRVEGLLKLADAVTEDLHRLAVNLRPASLDRYGLIPALEQLLTEFRRQTSLPVVFEAHSASPAGPGRLPDDVETALYRIVQESLTNVARHTHASYAGAACTVTVRLDQGEAAVSLTVSDDGPGFDVAPALASGRLGLLGMRERAGMLGGSLTIDSAPGRGATIQATLPLKGAEPDLTGSPPVDLTGFPPVDLTGFGSLPQQGPVRSAPTDETSPDPHLAEAAELARAKALSDALIDLTAELAACTNADDVLRLVLARSVAAIGREIAHITLREGAGWRIKFRYPEQLARDFYEDAEAAPWTHVEQTHEVLVVDDACAAGLPAAFRVPGERFGIKSYACIPLLAGPRFLGALTFADVTAGAPFHRTEVEFLNRLCVVVSLALDNVLLREAAVRQRDELARRVEELQAVAAQLQAAEAQARELIEHAPSGIYEVDLRTSKFISVNDALCQILGYTREELLNLSAFDVLDEANRARLLERQRLALGGEPFRPDAEFEVRRKDGSIIYSVLHTRLIWREGRPARAYVIAHDVTERHHAAEALAQQRSQSERLAAELETILSAIADGLVVYDAAGRIVRMNRRAEDILGFSEELRRLPYEQRVPAAAVGLHADGTPFARNEYPTVRALAGEVVRDMEMLMRLPGRSAADAWVSVSSGPIRRPDGSLAGAVTTFRDVSEMHRQAEELREAAARLEQRVQERTAELSAANAQLASANTQLATLSRRLVERQERERSYVADRLYNEAAQVIASFKWQAELLSREARRNAAPSDWLDDLTAQMDRALVELHSLASDLRPAVLDRAGLAAAVQQYAAEFAARHGVAVDCRVEGLRGVRLAEETETGVYRVLEEALANVSQHAGASRVTVSLTLAAGCVRLEVADNGAGFDVRAVEEREGVGLTAMRERAAALNGRLAIVSTPGAGASVALEAPANE